MKSAKCIREKILDQVYYIYYTTFVILVKIKNSIEIWNLHTQDLLHRDLLDIEQQGKEIKALKKAKRTRDTVGILDIRGMDVGIEFIEAKNNIVQINKNLITLPTKSYYMTKAKKLGKVDLKQSIPLFVKVIKTNQDIQLSPLTVKQTGGLLNLNKDSQEKLLEGSILTSFLNAMQITKTQLFMFGSMGIVAWETAQFVGKILLVLLTGQGGA